MMSISFFCCCEKVFTLMNVWKIGKNLMRLHYLKKKTFKVTLTWKILLVQIMHTEKRGCKDFKIKKLGEYNDLYV